MPADGKEVLIRCVKG